MLYHYNLLDYGIAESLCLDKTKLTVDLSKVSFFSKSR